MAVFSVTSVGMLILEDVDRSVSSNPLDTLTVEMDAARVAFITMFPVADNRTKLLVGTIVCEEKSIA